MPSPSPSPVTEEPSSIMSLPYDLLFNCFARVSRLYYPTLSLVSKTFRSIVYSSELYETRSRLSRTEKCLYLCLHFPSDTNTYWVTLYRKPNGNVADKSSGYLLVQVPSPNCLLPAQSSSVIAVGSNIYKIGGAKSYRYKFWKTRYSSSVSVLDCRSHRWRHAPGMRVARSSSSTVCEVDGKIYVAGGCKDDICSLYWMEVFDPKTQTWGTLKNPSIEYQNDIGYTSVVKSLGLDGKLYMFGSRCNTIGLDSDMACAVSFSDSVVDEVLFFWDDGVFKWYDSKARLWKKLNGVEGLPDFCHCLMVDVGGKMMVLWDEFVYYSTRLQENVIWCAEISLERRGDGDEIWGKVEWFDAVLPVHKSCHLVYAAGLSATL
ncbi:unnamed protein product [Arabidopsis lyrata]|uniref:F-box domain-containing protein n=1 Tax=Arabidopsis lyrata subsp. lyrata TaxID=81972 RepID=D7KVK0_ARALL|nr:hypothetical protein ARALYDRAFT_315222 [Arabidopsis lyrata subsp. lyrata]CAH8256240.1 unnamed protein product [Arabidopsis lyrata]